MEDLLGSGAAHPVEQGGNSPSRPSVAAPSDVAVWTNQDQGISVALHDARLLAVDDVEWNLPFLSSRDQGFDLGGVITQAQKHEVTTKPIEA